MSETRARAAKSWLFHLETFVLFLPFWGGFAYCVLWEPSAPYAFFIGSVAGLLPIFVAYWRLRAAITALLKPTPNMSETE